MIVERVFAYDPHMTAGFRFSGEEHPFDPIALERVRRSITLLFPKQPSGLDREAAIALIEELQRMQTNDRRVLRLLDEVAALLDAARKADGQDRG